MTLVSADPPTSLGEAPPRSASSDADWWLYQVHGGSAVGQHHGHSGVMAGGSGLAGGHGHLGGGGGGGSGGHHGGPHGQHGLNAHLGAHLVNAHHGQHLGVNLNGVNGVKNGAVAAAAAAAAGLLSVRAPFWKSFFWKKTKQKKHIETGSKIFQTVHQMARKKWLDGVAEMEKNKLD